MEIYWHYLWTLSRVHGFHYGTCSKCLHFLATSHCSASGLLGQTLGWVNCANDRKDRLFHSSQGLWCPLVHKTLQVPHKKNLEWWNPANMVASSRRRKGRKRCRGLKRSCSQVRLSRDVRVWVAGPSSWSDCCLSVPAHYEFRTHKNRLSPAMYRRVMTVTVSPASFKSERWLQADLCHDPKMIWDPGYGRSKIHRSCRSWILYRHVCRKILKILDLEHNVCR